MCADGLVGACEVRIDVVSTAVVLVHWAITCFNATKLFSFLLWFLHFFSLSIKMSLVRWFVRCLPWCLAVHVFLARLREVMGRMLPGSVVGSVVTSFVGSLYKTETQNHMWAHLQGDVSNGRFVRNVLSLGEWNLPVNPSIGLAERQNTVSLRQYWNYIRHHVVGYSWLWTSHSWTTKFSCGHKLWGSAVAVRRC